MYSDSHVEFIHPSEDLKDLDPEFLNSQINVTQINKIKPELLFLAAYVLPGKNSWQKLLWALNEYKKVIKKNGWNLVQKYSDLEIRNINIILHVEDLSPIGKDLRKISYLKTIGIRSVGLTHNKANQFAGGALTNLGLTDLGKEAVKNIIAEGLILDFAHLSKKAFFKIQKDFSIIPFISHTGLKYGTKNPRNISNNILKNIMDNNGYVGIGMAGSFLKPKDASISDYLKQIKYAVKIVGPKSVGIGSDLGGITSYLPKGIKNLESIPKLDLPRSILKDNLLNFIRVHFKNPNRMFGSTRLPIELRSRH